MHQIPPKPSAFRVKVWRRLQQIGAVSVKNSVYVLPYTAEALEDYQWLKQEIEDAGGEAAIFRADSLEAMDDRDVEALFQEARHADYTRLREDAQVLGQRIRDEAAHHAVERLDQWEAELLKLRERSSQLQRIDFFGAPARSEAEAELSAIADLLRNTLVEAGDAAAQMSQGADRSALRGRLWVTRARIYVDRMACGWLIRRFIDPDARFHFIDPAGDSVPEGSNTLLGAKTAPAGEPYPSNAIPFDMAGVEFGHHGDRCSFETLLGALELDDAALTAISQIVHDIDLKDRKFARPEAAGIQLALDGIAGDDAVALERAMVVFDALYAALSARAAGVRR